MPNPLQQVLIALASTALLVSGSMRLASSAGATETESDARQATIRVGTYDSRAIAIAFGRSDIAARQIAELRQKYADAKAAGDEKLEKELNEQGRARQVRMHLQAFSNAPVQDALDAVRDELSLVARDAGVVLITSAADFHDPSVELVDVTDELVHLFAPTDDTLRIIADCRKQKPLPIEQVAKIPPEN